MNLIVLIIIIMVSMQWLGIQCYMNMIVECSHDLGVVMADLDVTSWPFDVIDSIPKQIDGYVCVKYILCICM